MDSNRLVKASLLLCMLATSSITTPAFAQAAGRRADGADRIIVRSNEAAKAGRQSFGMAIDRGVTDPNNPAAAGGGSLGYNRKLLQY